MDLNQLQHYAGMAVNFDQQRNFEAAKYFYRQASALIREAVDNQLVKQKVRQSLCLGSSQIKLVYNNFCVLLGSVLSLIRHSFVNSWLCLRRAKI